jgi:hypothetical protein
MGVSISDLNLASTPDLVTVPDGTYEVAINSIGFALSSGGNMMLTALLDIVGEPNTKKVRYFMVLPTDDDDKEKADNKRRKMKTFCEAFKLDMEMFQTEVINAANAFTDDRVDITAFNGYNASAIITSRTNEGEEFNDIKRFVTEAVEL